MTQAQTLATPPRAPRSKVVAGLLACLLGVVGAQGWYLGRRHAWIVTLYAAPCLAGTRAFDSWWDNPAFFLLFIPMIAGFIEAAVYSLMADQKFDQRYNPGLGPVSRTGWPAVLVALLSCLAGGIVSMLAVAMVVVYVWTALGWLDGYVF